MVMNKLAVCRMVIVVSGILAVLTAAPTFAAESHFYAATHGLSASFYVIGGRYDIYVYAKRPIAVRMLQNPVAACLEVTSSGYGPPMMSYLSGRELPSRRSCPQNRSGYDNCSRRALRHLHLCINHM